MVPSINYNTRHLLGSVVASYPGHSSHFSACNIEKLGVAWVRRNEACSVACHDTFVHLFVPVATIPVVIVDMVQAPHSVNQMNSMTHLSHAQVSCTYHTSTVLFSRNKKNSN